VERSRDWLAQAQGDLDHARNDLADGYFDWACFSAQQSAEKALKAVLHRAGVEAWGHSVADLLQEISRSTPVTDELLDAAFELDKAYIGARYPDAHPSGTPRARYTRTEADRMVGHADAIVRFSEGLLSATEP
jgi:HEPN domain-containing protein